MEERLNAYLEALGVELWPGAAFYLTDPKEREKAVAWAAAFISELED